ncbi:MAG: lactate racemase domain-containing protein [Persicimonas sp.]
MISKAINEGFDASDFRGHSVAIAVPDLTRPIDYERVLPPLLARLDEAGCDVTIVVALGLHRPLSDAEIAPLVALAGRFGARVVQHDARADDLVEFDADVGADRAGWPTLPARFCREIAEADRVICVGVVEPHQYAGFSGGAKTVAIGCGSRATVSAMHGLEFLRDARTALGNTDDNPFQQALWELVRPLGPMWGLMAVPDGPDSAHAVRFGRLEEAFSACVEVSAEVFFEQVDQPYDWLHLPVEGPKAVNFYQASRAATYVALVDRPAIREGGLLVLEAACPEGIGQGSGERACAEAMLRGREALLAELAGDREVSTKGGQQRAYVLARALHWCDVALVGAVPMAELEAMGIEQFESIDEALDAYAPGGRGRLVSDVFHGVPRTG